MASKTYNVKSYTYYLGTAETLSLWSDETGPLVRVAYIRFVDDAMSLPAPTFTPGLTSCQATFRRSALPGLIDMLRNENPVSLTISDGPPLGYVRVVAGLQAAEPVGEGES